MKVYNYKPPQFLKQIQVVHEGSSNIDFVELLYKLASEISSIENYHFSEVWLHNYRSVGGTMNLYATYWDRETDIDDVDNGADSQPILHEIRSSDVNYIRVQMSKGKNQNNVHYLITVLADKLTELKASELLDVSLNDIEDEDGYENPTISAYFYA